MNEASMPCVATPVGGLIEQIEDGITGVVAKEVTALALSAAIRRLFFAPGLYQFICSNIAATAEQRSMKFFLSNASVWPSDLERT